MQLLKSLLLLISCANLIVKAYPQEGINKIIISSVTGNILTTFRISCEKFDTTFYKIKKEKVLTDSALMKKFEKSLNTIRFLKGDNKIDVRIKLYIYYSTNKAPVIICLDNFHHMLVNGQKIARNEKLLALITKVS